jgi:CrcB protein
VLVAVALGGAAGGGARHLLSVWAERPGGWPWAVILTHLAINVGGSAALGALMVLAVQRWPQVPMLRPALGVGVLGGFTSFSTYAVDVQLLIHSALLPVAVGYLVATPALAVLAVWVGTSLARRLDPQAERPAR